MLMLTADHSARDLLAVERLHPQRGARRVAREQRRRDAGSIHRRVLEVLDAEHGIELAAGHEQLAAFDQRHPSERLLDEQRRHVARAVPAPARQHLQPHERHHRHVGRLVTQVLVDDVEQERRAPRDVHRPRQEAVGDASAGVDGSNVTARVDRGGKRIDAVVGGHAVVAGRKAGAVAARVGETEVDVAHHRQRRHDLGAGRQDESFGFFVGCLGGSGSAGGAVAAATSVSRAGRARLAARCGPRRGEGREQQCEAWVPRAGPAHRPEIALPA